ncbi:YeeE/YedE thiosulfate transporter family protein [uncultured Cetobacterium sp.]|uniref:YeeE/YedE thiosulfate transporter family protein n=1 Tax=uncultured Cetobacterium sp. TaxID=527638 RepID=UPI00260C74B4|nr:YeeE/YedE thiosulfate transporter family protein [uncultured Cetobacterium sp.]
MERKWILKGIFLGSVFFISILLIKPIGISTQFSVVSGMVHSTIQDDIIFREGAEFYSLIDYYNQDGIAKSIVTPYNYGIIFVVGVFLGGMLGRIFFRKKEEFIEKESLLEKDRISRVKLFFGGVLLLFGARMAGGCTSGHMMSGIMQLSVSSIIFTIVLFPIAIIIAKGMGD